MDSELERHITFFRFEDLRVYHKSLDYIGWVIRRSNDFYDKDATGLGTRFSVSAQTIAMNISEGSARNKSQFIYYLKMAKSAVRECVVFTTLAEKLDYLTPDQVNESRGQLMEMTKMIGALIGSLQRSADMSAEDPD